MRLIAPLIVTVCVLVFSAPAFSQTRGEVRKTSRTIAPAAEAGHTAAEAKEEAGPAESPGEQTIRVYLIDGRRLEADEVTESADGYWYRRGNVTTLLDKTRIERIERGPETPPPAAAAPEDAQGSGSWSLADARKVEDFFLTKFGRPLPVTAFGQSDLHTRWGFDHRRSLDVGLHPDSREGRALIEYLRSERIPYLAFRHAIPGVATAPHIHIGRPSPSLRAR